MNITTGMIVAMNGDAGTRNLERIKELESKTVVLSTKIAALTMERTNLQAALDEALEIFDNQGNDDYSDRIRSKYNLYEVAP